MARSNDGRNRTASGQNQVHLLHGKASPLGRDQVALWWLATEATGPAEWHRWFAMLDEDERARAARFRFELDRREFIAAHALLRSMLTTYLDRPAAVWRFCTDANGKPALASEMALPEFQFNVSHTRGLVAVALVAHGKLGIDVEKIEASKAEFSIAEKYFAPSEVAMLRRIPEGERPDWFFRLWTLKEAYLKAIGTGLGAPLDSFAFTFDPICIRFAHADDDANHWKFETRVPSDQHVLSLAINRPSHTVHVAPRAVAAKEI